MGLRNQFLEGLNQGASGITDAAKIVQEQRQRGIREQFVQDLPNLLQGDVNTLAQRAEMAGEPQILQQLTAAKLKQASGPRQMTPEVLQAQGLSKEQAAIASSLPVDQQQDFIRNAFTTRQQRFQEQGEARRVKESGQQQRKMFVQDMNKVGDAFVKEESTVKAVQNALSRGTLPDDNIVFNFIARNVSQEKGPLSESDIARIIATTGAGTLEGAMNFIRGTSVSKLTPDQKKAFREIVADAANNFESRKDEIIGSRLASSIVDFPRLFEGEKPDDSILERAKRFGYEFKDGSFVKKGATKKEFSGDYSSAASLAAKLQGDDQSQAMRIIEKYQKAGKPLPPAFLKALQGE